MAITTNLDPWEEIRNGRADQAGADIYWLYCGVQKNDLKLIATTLKGIITREEWRRWRWIDQEFECSSLRECLLRKPPNGIGADLDLLKRLIFDDKLALDMLDEALRNDPGRPPDLFDKILYNVQDNPAPTGNRTEAMLRRLRKEAEADPRVAEIRDRVLAGEISAHAGAIEAGFRKKPMPLDQLVRWWGKASADERAAFLAKISETDGDG